MIVQISCGESSDKYACEYVIGEKRREEKNKL